MTSRKTDHIAHDTASPHRERDNSRLVEKSRTNHQTRLTPHQHSIAMGIVTISSPRASAPSQPRNSISSCNSVPDRGNMGRRLLPALGTSVVTRMRRGHGSVDPGFLSGSYAFIVASGGVGCCRANQIPIWRRRQRLRANVCSEKECSEQMFQRPNLALLSRLCGPTSPHLICRSAWASPNATRSRSCAVNGVSRHARSMYSTAKCLIESCLSPAPLQGTPRAPLARRIVSRRREITAGHLAGVKSLHSPNTGPRRTLRYNGDRVTAGKTAPRSIEKVAP